MTELYETSNANIEAHRQRQEELASHVESLVLEARKEREQHLQQMQSLKDEQTKLFEEWRKQHESQQQQQQQSPKPRYPVDFSPPS